MGQPGHSCYLTPEASLHPHTCFLIIKNQLCLHPHRGQTSMEVQSLAWSFHQLLWPGPMDPTSAHGVFSLVELCVCVCVCVLSGVQFSVIPWTVAHQAPLSMGFPRQEYWSGLPCPPPGDLLDPGIKSMSPKSPALQVDSLPLRHVGSLV